MKERKKKISHFFLKEIYQLELTYLDLKGYNCRHLSNNIEIKSLREKKEEGMSSIKPNEPSIAMQGYNIEEGIPKTPEGS